MPIPSSFLILTAVSIAFFSEAFLYGIAVPILPFMLQDKTDSADDLQWYCSLLLTAYSAATLAFAPLAGFVTDKTASRRAPFMAALLLLLLSVALFFSVDSIWLLFLTRCLQGYGTAFIWILGFTICSESESKEVMGRVMGTVLSAADFGAFFAPALGGILYKHFAMTAVLVATCIVSGVALLFGSVVPQAAADAARKYSEGEAGVEAGNPETTECTSLIPPDNSAFVLPPSDSKLHRVFPIIRCFREPSLVVSIVLVIVSAVFVSVFDATIPLHARHTFGFDSMDIGLLFIPMAVSRIITGPIGGWMVDKTSPRTVAVSGYSFLIPVYISLRWVKSEPREAEIGLYFALLALAGVGSAVVSIPSFVEASSVIDRYHQANADLFGDRPPAGALFGIFLSAFGAGSAIGPVLAGALRNSMGYGNMNGFMAGISAVAALLAFFWLERVPAKKSDMDEV